MSSKSNNSSATDNQNTEETCKLDTFIKNGFKTFIEATKASNELPKGRDYDFHNTQESFSSELAVESDRLLQMINKVFHANAVEGNIRTASLSNKDELMGDANDIILDRAVVSLDELNGLRSVPAAPVIQTVSADISINGSWNRVKKVTVTPGSASEVAGNTRNAIHLLTAKNIVRPQSYFKDKVDNSNKTPWKPRITDKPNSKKPLALYLEPSDEHEGFEEYSHPYEFELDHFVVPDEFVAEVKQPEPVKLVENTPLHEISTEKELDDLVEELRKYKEIAVDLEHHSYRTFQGITCLMQISTRNADYLIDTLALRHKLYVLNEIFTKPSILKIFHGADSDIQWLQRDLSLYVVNMFDTHQAAKLLGYSGLSLAYLLQRFCSFMPNKKFQLADWRIRPLPQELKDYAREDTHYLIYVYEMLKKELYKKANGMDNLVRAVFKASTEVCKKKYVKPRWTPDAHLRLHERRKKQFDNRQLFALKELYKWRDNIAREEDESTGYVLPNHMMLQISEMLPREVQGILASCKPIPPLVRSNSLELHQLILRAREQPLEKPIMQETNRRILSKETVRINIDSPLHCPHDLTKQHFNDNLPTLLDFKKSTVLADINSNILPLEKEKSTCKLFNRTEKNLKLNCKISGIKFLGPYERYKLMKPFLQHEADEEKAKEAEKEKVKAESEKDPSVYERIVALHKHFLEEVNKTKSGNKDSQFPQRLPNTNKLDSIISLESEPQPLINMPGSKKRKRDESLDAKHQKQTREETHETPSPRNQGIRNRGRKRRSQEHRDKTTFTVDAQPRQNPNFPKRMHHDRESNNPQQKKNPANKNRNKNWRGKRNSSGNRSNPPRNNPEEQTNRGNYSRFLPKQEPESPQKASDPFDYSKVDYSQFSGGAKAVYGKQVDSKHRGKGQNKRGGRGNRGQSRSMTFNSNARGKGKNSSKGRSK